MYNPRTDSPTAYIATLDADTRIATGERVDALTATSIAQDCIAHEDYEDGMAAMLEAQSDDMTITDTGIEYLGADDDGRPWRVHLDRAED